MLNTALYRSKYFPFSPCYAIRQIPTLSPFYGSDPDFMSKFLRRTPEQLERVAELKRYSRKLLGFRMEFAKHGRKATFSMYEILSIEINSPIDGSVIRVLLKEYNSTDILLYSPLLPYTILFEDCPNGFALLQRLKTGKLIS